MTARTTPPFRADHVGSFLRPKYLLDAREQFFVKKAITAEQLRAVEDRAIAEVAVGVVGRARQGPRAHRAGDAGRRV